MIQINTRSFGEIEIAEEKVIDFSRGLPGFPGLTKYTLITNPDEEDSMFLWLQSLEDGDVAFCLADLSALLPEYNPLVDESEIEELGPYSAEELHIYNITVIPDDPKDITVNLKAPIVINPLTMLGIQVICQNEGYNIRHPLIDEKKAGC